MEGVVAKPDCTRDIDCSFRIKCGKGVITVCNKGQCQCVHPPRSGNPTSMNSSPASWSKIGSEVEIKMLIVLHLALLRAYFQIIKDFVIRHVVTMPIAKNFVYLKRKENRNPIKWLAYFSFKFEINVVSFNKQLPENLSPL